MYPNPVVISAIHHKYKNVITCDTSDIQSLHLNLRVQPKSAFSSGALKKPIKHSHAAAPATSSLVLLGHGKQVKLEGDAYSPVKHSILETRTRGRLNKIY